MFARESESEGQRMLLVGTWRYDARGHQVTWILHSDGSWVGIAKPTTLTAKLLVGTIHYSGTWEVKDGRLVAAIVTTTSSTIPTGTMFSDKILELSRTSLVIKSPRTGKVERHLRVE